MSDGAQPEIPKPSRWDRLSTGLKMWIVLSVGLLPLGIVAVVASVDNARASRAKAAVEAQTLVAVHGERLAAALARNAFAIRVARDAIIESGDPAGICRRTLDRLARPPNTPGRFALYGQGSTPLCASPGFAPPAPLGMSDAAGRATILPGGEALEIFLYDPSGALEGIADYRRDGLAAVVEAPAIDGDFALDLVQDGRTMPLRARASFRPEREITADYPLDDGQYSLRIGTEVPPMTLSEILVILTPILMWLWASLVGWIIVQRLLLRPLGRIQQVIAAYKPGDRGVDLPELRTPAREIGALGLAFDRVTQTVARHEAELEAAVARQTRLVREVHHRVKNNLQVVASLLNLHSRGSANQEVAAAYASIQRRVDALAVVHRNHFAELEDNRGVGLKPLISELTANLRATAPAGAVAMQIRLDIAPLHATQDVAVSVAFLVTEIVEFGMLCGAAMVTVALDEDGPGGADLSVEVDSLARPVECDAALAERFDRIITGLARQLRSTLERDPGTGRYAVRIAVVDGRA